MKKMEMLVAPLSGNPTNKNTQELLEEQRAVAAEALI